MINNTVTKFEQYLKQADGNYGIMYPKTQADCVSVSGASNLQTKLNQLDQSDQENAKQGIYTLTCGYNNSAKKFTLTGTLPAGVTLVSGVFKATADYTAGDTFQVGSTSYTIQTLDGKALTTGAFKSGSVVPVVLDTGNKKINFKQAGGQVSLPAEAYVIVKTFTQNGTFTPPLAGKYRITCIGKGGDGGGDDGVNPIYLDSMLTGSGGGAGGISIREMSLTQNDSYEITVSSGVSSFGNLASATSGNNGTTDSSSYNTDNTISAGGTGSLGLKNYSGNRGEKMDTGGISGGAGGGYASQYTPFVSRTGAPRNDAGRAGNARGYSCTSVSACGGYAYGAGGGGNLGGFINISTSQKLFTGYPGKGNTGAVIIEMLLN